MSVLTDFWQGVKDASREKLTDFTQRVTTNNPVSAGGAAAAGRSIVDVFSETLALAWRGETDEARRKAAEAFAQSGTGSKFITEVRQQEISNFLKNPVVWVVGLIVIFSAVALLRGR